MTRPVITTIVGPGKLHRPDIKLPDLRVLGWAVGSRFSSVSVRYLVRLPFCFWLSQLFRFRHFRDRDTAKNSPEANDSVPDSRPGRARKTPMRAPGFFVIFACLALSCRASSERGHSGPTHANVEATDARVSPEVAAVVSASPLPPVPLRPPSEPPPPDVAAPPRDAKMTASGVAMKDLHAGPSTEHPKLDDCVKMSFKWSNRECDVVASS